MGNGLGPFETNAVRFSGLSLHLTTQTNLVQVGANNDWIDISSSHNDGWYTLGIRADGSLWVWGEILQYGNRQPGQVFSVPTRVCKETNWVHLDGRNAFTRDGEMWCTLYAAPDASMPASSNCDYLITNCLPEKFALAGSALYQLHSDGTLWRVQLDYNQDHTVSPSHQGTRVGNRSDWSKLWGSRGTAIGLTRDGTLWIWGTDLGQEGVMMLRSRMGIVTDRIRAFFGFTPTTSRFYITPVQPEPRPLMKIRVLPDHQISPGS
jgi:alpha-tubulin suppressor-like RCC1 family protein